MKLTQNLTSRVVFCFMEGFARTLKNISCECGDIQLLDDPPLTDVGVGIRLE